MFYILISSILLQEIASADYQAHEDTNESGDVGDNSAANKRIDIFVTKALEKLDKRINQTIDIAVGDEAPKLVRLVESLGELQRPHGESLLLDQLLLLPISWLGLQRRKGPRKYARESTSFFQIIAKMPINGGTFL